MDIPQATVAETLGGYSVLGQDVHNDMDATDVVLHGIPWRAAFAVQRRYGLTDDELAKILDVSVRTLSRHRQSNALLPTAESDRLYRSVSILSWAAYVLEDDDRAMAWLRRPQTGLGDRVPMALLVAGTGARQVEDLLGCIEFGVYS
jgi:putative toxin-antitoxin system antitoxin component (TIGR02293 family)